MSGDCGHGWMYHLDGASGPCYKCVEEDKAAGTTIIVTGDIIEQATYRHPTPKKQGSFGRSVKVERTTFSHIAVLWELCRLRLRKGKRYSVTIKELP